MLRVSFISQFIVNLCKKRALSLEFACYVLRTRNVDMYATYTRVYVLNCQSRCICNKNVGRMHEAIEQSKRYQTSHIEQVYDITVWNYEL